MLNLETPYLQKLTVQSQRGPKHNQLGLPRKNVQPLDELENCSKISNGNAHDIIGD